MADDQVAGLEHWLKARHSLIFRECRTAARVLQPLHRRHRARRCDARPRPSSGPKKASSRSCVRRSANSTRGWITSFSGFASSRRRWIARSRWANPFSPLCLRLQPLPERDSASSWRPEKQLELLARQPHPSSHRLSPPLCPPQLLHLHLHAVVHPLPRVLLRGLQALPQ